MTDVETDAVVVGGGLAGLTAAAFLARSGVGVRVLEKRSEPGGRARTPEREGFRLDLGAHAVYREGAAAAAYRRLGLELEGGTPDPDQLGALDGGELFPFPAGPANLLRASGLSLRGRLAFGRFFLELMRANPGQAAGMPVGPWIRRRVADPVARRLVRSLVRLSTYSDDLGQDAGAVLAQLRMTAGEGVLYPDGGWGAVVDRLRRRAEELGARLRCSSRVEGVARDGRRWAVRLADGSVLGADVVVLAAGAPETAVDLLDDPPASLRRAADRARPVRVACLDVGLADLPVPSRPAVLAADRPLYASDYASVADVAPEGGALVHAVRYVDGGDAEAAERELAGFLDRVQPGWRQEVVTRQFLPEMTVAHDRPDPGRGGLRGRFGPDVPDAPALFVAGDWVGPTGLLSDAAVASGRRAAERVVEAGASPAPGPAGRSRRRARVDA